MKSRQRHEFLRRLLLALALLAMLGGIFSNVSLSAQDSTPAASGGITPSDDAPSTQPPAPESWATDPPAFAPSTDVPPPPPTDFPFVPPTDAPPPATDAPAIEPTDPPATAPVEPSVEPDPTTPPTVVPTAAPTSTTDASLSPTVGDIALVNYDCDTGQLTFRVPVTDVPHVPEGTSGFDYRLDYSFTSSYDGGSDYVPSRFSVWSPPADEAPYTGDVELTLDVPTTAVSGAQPGTAPITSVEIRVGVSVNGYDERTDSSMALFAIDCESDPPPTTVATSTALPPTEPAPSPTATSVPTGDVTVIVPFTLGTFAGFDFDVSDQACLTGSTYDRCLGLQDLDDVSELQFAGVPPGDYTLGVYAARFQSIERLVTIIAQTGTVTLDPVDLEMAEEASGLIVIRFEATDRDVYDYLTDEDGFPVEILDSRIETRSGVFERDPNDPMWFTYTVREDFAGTDEFEVQTSSGPITVRIVVLSLVEFEAGNANVVVPVHVGLLADVGNDYAEICLTSASATHCDGVGSLGMLVEWARLTDVPPGVYTLSVFVDGYIDADIDTVELTAESGNFTLDPIYLDDFLPGVNGSVTVALEQAYLPPGAELCLVSDADAFCNPIPESVERAGIVGFAQPAGIDITFPDVPPGNYLIVLRAPGFQDLVLDQIVLGDGQVLEVGPFTAAELEAIQPIEPTATVAPTQTVPPGGLVCAPDADRAVLRLIDPNSDGNVSIAELESTLDSLGDGEENAAFRSSLTALLDGADEAGITGYVYDGSGPCAPATVEPTTEPTEPTLPPTSTPTQPAPTATPTPEPTAEPTEPTATAVPDGAGSVTVDIDPEGLPAGSQLCLVNEETGEERCEPVPATGGAERPGILAFRQAASVTITFENVPAGTWRLILRAPGFEDFVISSNLTVIANQESDAGVVPPDVETRLEPVTPPSGNVSLDLLIRLLIAILIQILLSLGIL